MLQKPLFVCICGVGIHQCLCNHFVIVPICNIKKLPVTLTSALTVIFVWPWNENAQTKQKQQMNRNRGIWLVCRVDTNACDFWLVKRTLWWKKRYAWQLSRNQPIVCFDVILQHDWPIEQHLLYTKVFFDRITQRRCFDLFIHWLIKQQTRTETTFQGHMKISLINY